MSILIIAEHDNKHLKPANYHTLSAAQELGDKIDVLIVGYDIDAVIQDVQSLPSLNKILVANDKVYEHQLAENCSALISEIARKYNYVLTSANTFGKNCLPRIAALLDMAMIADVVKIIGPETFVRPIYAGNALATVQTKEAIKLLTIRSTGFVAVKPVEHQQIPIEILEKIIPNDITEFKSQELTHSSRPELTDARIVISGGRGLKSAENFKLLEKIAEQLGAAVGASRAAVDAGFVPNDYQVGQTGKVIAPDLYIAVGISGAIQHVAGMKDSKVIVAINNDADAPIFQIADYGLVGDLFVILPELQAELEKDK